jgi:glycosyltransferase involved in cell wall biosynthesis
LRDEIVEQKDKIKIIAVAPLPPPTTGMALASKVLVDRLSEIFKFECINMSKQNFQQGKFTLTRILEIIKLLWNVFQKSYECDIGYLTVSQSLAGNIKDILILLLMRTKKRVIHLHGGGIRKVLFDRYPFLMKINKIILSNRVDKVVVLGPSLHQIYNSIMDPNKICSVLNFAQEEFFKLPSKSKSFFYSDKIKIVYLSNMLPGKGYDILAQAVLIVNKKMGQRFTVDFIGSFSSAEEKDKFLEIVGNNNELRYWGPIIGDERTKYLAEAHVFCLPTTYPYGEGQPISILEAYAAGAIVITTDIGGIPDIFVDKKNGFLIEGGTQEALVNILIDKILMGDRSDLYQISQYNQREAQNLYTEDRYIHDMADVFFSLVRKEGNSTPMKGKIP